jgi:CBS domain-containing protein
VAEQAKTEIGQIFYIRKGAIELYYEQNGEKTLGARLVAGETFGGISILMNAGVAVRTAKVEDDAPPLCDTRRALPGNVRTNIRPFRNYFTEEFQAAQAQ